MALSPEASDSAPFAKLKKKKKKREKNKVSERSQGDEGRGQGDEGRSQGDEGLSQGDKGKSQGDEGRSQGDEGRSQGDEGLSQGDKGKSQGDEGRSQGDKGLSQGDEGKSQGDEGLSQGDEGRSQGSKGLKKKRKKRVSVKTEGEETSGATEGGKKRKQGDEGRDQGDEEMRKKKRRRENGTQPKEMTQGNKTRKKVGRKRNKVAQQRNRVQPKEDVDDTEQEIEVSSSDLLELEEFIPDVRTKTVDVKQKLMRYDLPRFREFKKHGLKLRWGRYSEEENLRIRRNVENFLKLTQIQTPEELFFPQRFPELEQNLKELKSRHEFYQRIAEGLLRTCDQVYTRGKRIFDPRNHMGRFSEDEFQALQKLHTLHGNDWKTIGNKLERSIYACQKRHSQIGEHHGSWTPEEMHRLKKAAKKHLKRVLESSPSPGPGPGPGSDPGPGPGSDPGPGPGSDPGPGPDLGPSFIQLCSKMPWMKISRKVQTRSWIQCRAKWFSYLKSRLKAPEPKVIRETSKRTRVRLIQTLFELKVEDVSDVDWIQVAESVGAVTPMCVQRLFHRMKVSRVPDWTNRSFGDVVDCLFENELPQLLKRLKSRPRPGPEPGPGLGPARFSLDFLFPPDQEDFTEVDNS